MRIETVYPPPPPLPAREIKMSFPNREGWALVAALTEYADRHPRAVAAALWREWARALDAELRR